MVKKGEYFEYAIRLEEKTVDYDPLGQKKDDEFVVSTEVSMIVEIAKKVKELEERIKKLEEVRT